MPAILVPALGLVIAAELLFAVPVSAQSPAPAAKTLQTRVWVNNNTRVYHCPGTRDYGTTRNGEFMEEAQARGHGNRAVGARGCDNVTTTGPAPLPDTAQATKAMVWVNTESGVYHCPSSSDWGMTRRGRYRTEADASGAGHKPAAGRMCITDPQNEAMVRVRSTRNFSQTVSALDSALSAANLTVFGRVDHAANARGVSLDLRPTTVFIFGNPQVGTRLMQCEQTIAIDLPLKILVWEDSARAVFVGYEPPARLAERHNMQGCREVTDRIATALGALTAAATGTK